MGNILCSCDILKENKKTILLTYIEDNQNNENLEIFFQTNKNQKNKKKQNKKMLNINNTNLNIKNSFNSIGTIDKNENRNILNINKIEDDEIIINYSNNSNFDHSQSNRNSSLSIMKVNAVLSIENINENQESSSINKQLIFEKLVNRDNSS